MNDLVLRWTAGIIVCRPECFAIVNRERASDRWLVFRPTP